jgi:hypothetical protein
VSLISSLAEAQQDIVETMSGQPTILNFLFGLLNVDSIPAELYEDSLVCLIAIVEENRVVAQQIADHEQWLSGLMHLRTTGGMRGIAACGVLHNVFDSLQWFEHNTPVPGASDATLVPTLVENMNQFHAQAGQSNDQSSHASPDQILQLALEITASIATSLQEALENGNRMEKEFEGFADESAMMENGHESGAEDEAEEEDGDEDGDEDGEMNDEEIQADMDLVTGDASDDEDGGPEDQQTLDLLVRRAAPAILRIVQSRDTNQMEENSTPSHALAALNNIAWTVSSIDFASANHLGGLKKAWAAIAQQAWNEIISPVLASNTADISLAATITSLAWAIARSVQGQIQLQPEEQRKFMALYQASKGLAAQSDQNKSGPGAEEDAFQGLGVKSIGVLGRLALDPAPIELNREIGVFLLTVLAALPDCPPADAVEALNELFDIYGDKSYACDAAVFWQDGFYKHIEEILPKVRKMAKSIDMRKFPELR